MINRVKLFNLITMIEREHNFHVLDSDCRAVLNFIGLRQIENLPNDAVTIIHHLEIPRPTVYRKLTTLKDKKMITDFWINQKLNYRLADKAERFLGKLLIEARNQLIKKN